MNFLDFLRLRSGDMVTLGIQHVAIVAAAVLLATVIGVPAGVATYRIEWAREVALAVAGAIFTIPTFALLVLFIAPLGLGAKNVIATLALYGLMPILRNTITALREIDPAIIESAMGMGMNRRQRFFRIEFPIAWPVIMAGIRIATLLIVAGAAIGAIVLGPGYGELIFTGLYRVGTGVAVNLALAGMLGVVAVAILFEFLFSALRRLTISKGNR